MDMDIANVIRELRASTGMTRKAFSEHTGIPVRTLEDGQTYTAGIYSKTYRISA